MLTGIDHLIIATPDPAAAADELESKVGLRATAGGRHAGLGTYNRIAWLGDAYLELIGVEDAEAARGHPVGRSAVEALEHGGGFCGFALSSDRLAADVAHLRASGSSIGEPTHGSRETDGGELVEWWSAFPEETPTGALPFLIQHAPTGAEWSPAAVAERQQLAHPLGGPVVLARLDLAADDPAGMAAAHHEQLGIEFWAVTDLAVTNVGRHAIRLVPTREMPVPAVITVGAEIEELPRTVEALGVRFDLEYVDLPLPAPNRA